MLDLNNIIIGKIVKSNTHIDYICQIFALGESTLMPEPADYTFGTFVALEMEPLGAATGAGQRLGADQLIGVIYNTLLLNPDFGNLGPRLSPRQELEIFTPDYLAETATLVGIIAVGWRDANGGYHQGVPPLAASVNNFVHRLDEQELQAFHCGANDQPCLHYTPVLLAQNNPLVSPLLLAIIDRLRDLFPNSRRQLEVMRNNIAWKSIVQPAG